MGSNKKVRYAAVGLVLIAGLTFAGGCASTDKKPVSPTITEKKPTVKEQPVPANTEQVIVPKKIVTPPLPSDAKGLLQQSAQNTLNAESYAATMTMNTELMGMNMSFIFDIKKYGQIIYESGTIMGMTFELYSDTGNKTIVVREPRSQRWQRIPSNQENMLFSFEQMQRKLYLDNIKDACFKDDEKIGETNCRVIEATVNPEDLQKLLMNKNELPMELGDFSFSKVYLKLWVGKDDGLFYKSSASLTGAISMAMPAGYEGEDGEAGKEGKDIQDIEDEDPPITPTNKAKSPSGKQMMGFKYEIEIAFFNYNKLEPIIIPPDAKNVTDNIKDKKTPEDEDEPKEE